MEDMEELTEKTGMSDHDLNEVIVIEANIDDLNPQIYSYVMDKLLAIGALDVWLTPIIMKKGRPATQLSVLLHPGLQEKVTVILFTETSTIGMRYYKVKRAVAAREFMTVQTPWGDIQVKVSSYQGQVCNIAPEFEDCKRLATAHNISLKKIQQVATAQAVCQWGK